MSLLVAQERVDIGQADLLRDGVGLHAEGGGGEKSDEMGGREGQRQGLHVEGGEGGRVGQRIGMPGEEDEEEEGGRQGGQAFGRVADRGIGSSGCGVGTGEGGHAVFMD